MKEKLLLYNRKLRRDCLIKHVIEGKIEGKVEVRGRQKIRRMQLLDDLKEKSRY
jgi:hypothetical protein